jgi:hypothetical protein
VRFAWIVGVVGALALAIGVQTAMAEAQVVQRTDPKAESPAGVIYQIPLDSARRDAAPVLPTGRRSGTGQHGYGAGGGGTGGSGPGGTGAANAGGSPSASVADPRQAQAAGVRAKASSISASAGVETDTGTPQDPSSIHSENGFGSASQVPGVSQAALRTGAGVAATQTAGSTIPIYLLLALIAIAATSMGVLSTRRRRDEDGDPTNL